MKTIAIFPIPNCVTYPGQKIPLHIFEPRYRQMIQDCLHARRELAVCHITKTIQAADYEVKHLGVYEPVGVVSYGPIRLEEVLPDGRMIVEACMSRRAYIMSVTQRDPYLIAQIEDVKDEVVEPSVQRSLLQAELSARFERIWRMARPEQEKLPFDALSVPFADLSFNILCHVAIDPVFGQTLLEVRDPTRRAAIVCEILKAAEARVPGGRYDR